MQRVHCRHMFSAVTTYTYSVHKVRFLLPSALFSLGRRCEIIAWHGEVGKLHRTRLELRHHKMHVLSALDLQYWLLCFTSTSCQIHSQMWTGSTRSLSGYLKTNHKVEMILQLHSSMPKYLQFSSSCSLHPHCPYLLSWTPGQGATDYQLMEECDERHGDDTCCSWGAPL